MIPYGHHDVNQSDIDAVVNVLKSNYLTQGPAVPEFEQCIARYTGAKFAFAMNSATSALHVSCLALGLSPGDWLWTTPITFVASANCALYCGAQVDFVDIDAQTYNLCVRALEVKLALAEKLGKLPKILVAVHLAGQSCDMARIRILSEKYGFKVIEDASHGIGGKYMGAHIGNCRFSDITIFSFHPVKIITTAEGGMALTNCASIAEKIELLRNHGITRQQKKMTQEAHGPWYYEQISLGFNYRMSELQAALGVSQMQRLDKYVECRHSLARRYNALLSDLPVITPWQQHNNYSAFHLYIIRLELKKINKTHLRFFQEMRNYGVGVNLHYIPVYKQPYYATMGFKSEDFPEAEKYYCEAMSLPIYPTLTEACQDIVVNAIYKSLI